MSPRAARLTRCILFVQRCDDVRYNGPMRTIFYDYQNSGPHGAIIDEKYPGIGVVSSIDPVLPTEHGTIDTFTETRGDGPTRTIAYTHLVPCIGDDCDGACAAYGESEPHNQMLDHYTDFQGQTTSWVMIIIPGTSLPLKTRRATPQSTRGLPRRPLASVRSPKSPLRTFRTSITVIRAKAPTLAGIT